MQIEMRELEDLKELLSVGYAHRIAALKGQLAELREEKAGGANVDGFTWQLWGCEGIRMVAELEPALIRIEVQTRQDRDWERLATVYASGQLRERLKEHGAGEVFWRETLPLVRSNTLAPEVTA